MQITRIGMNELTISGHIKKTENYFDLKRTLTEMLEDGAKDFIIKISESITITSSVIGLFLRLINEDKVKVTMHVGEDQLYQLLDSLNMLKVFNVTRL